MKPNTFDLRGPDVKSPLGATSHAPLRPAVVVGRFFMGNAVGADSD